MDNTATICSSVQDSSHVRSIGVRSSLLPLILMLYVHSSKYCMHFFERWRCELSVARHKPMLNHSMPTQRNGVRGIPESQVVRDITSRHACFGSAFLTTGAQINCGRVSVTVLFPNLSSRTIA